MDFKCPFYHDNPDGKPAANAPCKFQENPYRTHITYCTVCGQSRDLRYVGRRHGENLFLTLILLAAIYYILSQRESQIKQIQPTQAEQTLFQSNK